MKFTELDQKLRVFETAHDLCVLPGLYMVTRLDGRNFTRLTKEILDLEAPFDSTFRDAMVATVQHLMNCGFRVIYGYTQSDEVSLLLHPEEQTFARKLRKLNSVLAAEASAKLSLILGSMAVFDCRISQLPTVDLVVDYFRWRQEDAHRNALNAHCYWMLRKSGDSASTATQKLEGLSVGDKNELLFQLGPINFNDLPHWQKRGVGCTWQSYPTAGINPMSGEASQGTRTKISIEVNLPMKEDYREFVLNLMTR